jgi:putative hydrolase of the HAD superfamily
MTKKVVFLDALGTLVELPAPAPALVEELARRGVTVSLEEAGRAMRREIAYYREHHDVASTRERLEELRDRCTEVVRAELPAARDLPDLKFALLAALRFRPYPEVPETLRALRAAGARLAVVSNWDVSLHDVLGTTGLAPLVDFTITSAEHGAAKPDPSIFAAALARAGAAPHEALHVGDSLEHDVAGALAAGIEPVLVSRDNAEAPSGTRTITSLSSLIGT